MSQSPNAAAPQEVAFLLASATKSLKAGQPADAIAPLRDAARLQPTNSIIHHDLGLACLEVGRIPDAIAAFQRAVASNPRYSDAYFRLGIALEKLGDIVAAIVAYDRATELLPSLSEAWFRAGALVYTQGHLEEAIGCFRRAAATGGNTSFGRLGKARALLTEDRNTEAELVLRKTLARDPQNALAHDLLGNLLSEFGRFDEARACFERAIEITPLLAGSYYDLVRCRRVTSDDDGLLQRMEAAVTTPGLEAAQLLRVHLAIGKAADDLGDYALAMQHFDSADTERRGFGSFDSSAFSASNNLNDSAFNQDTANTAGGINGAGPTPGVGLNSFYGPWLARIDVGLARSFELREGKELEFQAQVFNLFNHANYYVQNGNGINQLQYKPIGTNCGDGATLNQTCYLVPNSGPGNFGALQEINPNGLPRVLQFAARFTF